MQISNHVQIINLLRLLTPTNSYINKIMHSTFPNRKYLNRDRYSPNILTISSKFDISFDVIQPGTTSPTPTPTMNEKRREKRAKRLSMCFYEIAAEYQVGSGKKIASEPHK